MPNDILHVISSTDRRGAETFAVDLQAALSARGHQGETVALVAGSSGGVAAPVLGSRRFSVEGWRALRRRMADADATIAHGSDTLLACALAQPGTRSPFVYRNIGDPRFWATSALRRARVRLFLSRAAAVVALWPGSADALMSILGVPAQRIRVIPNGRPAASFPLVDGARRSAARKRLGLDGAVVAYVGALEGEKRLDVAIGAIAAIPDVTLVVAGAGSLRADLERLATEQLPGRARFVGAVSDPCPVLAAADVLVLTSDSEGLPAVLIEAGLSGLPVVATAVGGVPTIVAQGETGMLVPPNDPSAVTAALRDAIGDADRMGRAARQRCMERFEMAPVAQQWDNLLGSVVGSR